MEERIKKLANISEVLHDCERRLDGILNLTSLGYYLDSEERKMLDEAVQKVEEAVKSIDRRMKKEKYMQAKAQKK